MSSDVAIAQHEDSMEDGDRQALSDIQKLIAERRAKHEAEDAKAAASYKEVPYDAFTSIDQEINQLSKKLQAPGRFEELDDDYEQTFKHRFKYLSPTLKLAKVE